MGGPGVMTFVGYAGERSRFGHPLFRWQAVPQSSTWRCALRQGRGHCL